MDTTTTLTPPSVPAWREPMVWLVVSGPAIVVVASFVTLALAIIHPDPPLELHATAQAADDVEPADLRAREGDVVPAMVARNHAATGAAGVKR
jgi:hypothetical protein